MASEIRKREQAVVRAAMRVVEERAAKQGESWPAFAKGLVRDGNPKQVALVRACERLRKATE